ncbi:MAG: hypothetical protein EXS32_02310 [Opitutus sp.]|nr:hypothetical protein [Opitutus sp.]
MKSKPAVVAALIVIAVLVSSASAVGLNRLRHRVGSPAARAGVVSRVVALAAKALGHSVVRWAKS